MTRLAPRAAAAAGSLLLVASLMACAARPRAATETSIEPEPAAAPADRVAVAAPAPLLPPRAARLLGLMPRRTIGAEQFVAAHPAYDGRGVLIGVLDSGLDPTVPGLRLTTTGEPKVLDLRDFSGEGRIALRKLTPDGGTVSVGGTRLRGYGRVRALAVGDAWGGVLVERHLGSLPAADLNGDGDRDDALPVLVARASGGWFVMADTDGDGSLDDESPVRDFALAGETFTYGPVAIGANLTDDGGTPRLDLVFDTSGHGTHVAGIAAGHDMFEVAGFDGIAPGAYLLGLKIANNARGGITVTGSMATAMEYAARFAARRGLPLVLNLSFGIGGGRVRDQPVIDSLIDAFALAHPEVVFVISAGNDGPGVSTVGFPGSAAFALSACALFPGAFVQAPGADGRSPDDVLGWWSARGGIYQKPDVCVPGVAFSNVPAWQTGEEVSGGTSMAAPQLAGAAALLQSAMLDEHALATAAAIGAALRNTAQAVPGATAIDAGAGVPNVEAAYRWLRAGHRAGRFAVRSAPNGGNLGFDAAYRRDGLAPSDTLQEFTVASEGGQPFARLLLGSDAPWITAPDALEFAGRPVTVTVRYDRAAVASPGLYVGTVWARPMTDTTGGAAFGLTSTVVVPYDLATRLEVRRYVPAGRLARFFMRVPDGAGGLTVRAAVTDEEQAVSLYLFEPTGQPQRDESSLEIGGPMPASGTLLVRGEDVVPGVYEAVLVAPPNRSATVDFTAELAPVAIAVHGPDGIRVTSRGAGSMQGSASVRPVGATRAFRIGTDDGGAGRERLSVPPWASRIRVDVVFTMDLWRRITDVGMSLWDGDGYLVSESPLNYAHTRHVVEIEAGALPVVDLELMPGFALPSGDMGWEAEVRVAFLAAHELAPPVTTPLRIMPGSDQHLAAWSADSVPWLPSGLDVLTEVSVVASGSSAARVQAVVPPNLGTR